MNEMLLGNRFAGARSLQQHQLPSRQQSGSNKKVTSKTTTTNDLSKLNGRFVSLLMPCVSGALGGDLTLIQATTTLEVYSG